jgi:hypothetical protein
MMTPDIPHIKKKVYQELYALADWMLKTKPWKRMQDTHAFVIVDPDTNERQLAVVMGNAEIVYALHLYQPEEGTRWYHNIQYYEDSPQSQHAGQFENRYLTIEFDDGSGLDEHDERLDDLYAPEDWFDEEAAFTVGYLDSVVFRSIVPAHAPWHPEPADTLRMLDGLRLLKRYYSDYFEEYAWAGYFVDPNESVITLPTFTLPPGAKRADAAAWHFAMEPFDVSVPKTIPHVPPDEMFVARLNSLPVEPGVSWEAGIIFSPTPVSDGGRPFFPVVPLVVERDTEWLSSSELSSPLEPREQIFRASITEAAITRGYLPGSILVGSPISELALADLAAARDIKVVPAPDDMALFHSAVKNFLEFTEFSEDEEEDDLEDLFEESCAQLNELMHERIGHNPSPAEITAFFSQLNHEGLPPEFLNDLALYMGLKLSPDDMD